MHGVTITIITVLLLPLGTSFHNLPQIHGQLQKIFRSLLKHEAINNNNINATERTKTYRTFSNLIRALFTVSEG